LKLFDITKPLSRFPLSNPCQLAGPISPSSAFIDRSSPMRQDAHSAPFKRKTPLGLS
jgi:hypothetical protein